MTPLLNDREKQVLNELLTSPIFQKAATLALTEVWRRKRGMETTEQCAMAFQYQEGARDLVETLYGFAEIRQNPQILPRKLIHR
jgi:hypothetical protein